MASKVDARLLKSTKFPPEFNQRVDMKKVNEQVMKKFVSHSRPVANAWSSHADWTLHRWIHKRIGEILNGEDDVLSDLCMNLLKARQFPDIKSIQIQLTGFLDKDTASFCKELWNMLLSAQSNKSGVPQELLEAKKLELMQKTRLRDEAIATTTVIPEIVGLAATVGRLPQDAVIVPFRTVDGEDMVVVARDPLPLARVVVVLETRMDVTATSHRRDVAVIRSRDVAQAVDHCLVHARARARVVPSHPVDALRLRLDRGTHERDRDLLAALAIDDVVLAAAVAADEVFPAVAVDPAATAAAAAAAAAEAEATAAIAAGRVAAVGAAVAVEAAAQTDDPLHTAATGMRDAAKVAGSAATAAVRTIAAPHAAKVDAMEVLDTETAGPLETKADMVGGVTVHPNLHPQAAVGAQLMFWKINDAQPRANRWRPLRKTTRWVAPLESAGEDLRLEGIALTYGASQLNRAQIDQGLLKDKLLQEKTLLLKKNKEEDTV
ncbi:hypothetical protein PLIIFM63780_007202 [Purpureocillium lilacinum]|nr:hypothetical protein PLIIFM63780_007202 [Purpureocillium lilacinum]